jgi:hypothetical protein
VCCGCGLGLLVCGGALGAGWLLWCRGCVVGCGLLVCVAGGLVGWVVVVLLVRVWCGQPPLVE